MLYIVVMKAIVAGIFGAMVGSFVNVLIYRLPRESLTVNKPRRSFCPACGTAIAWYDNIPILSYLRLAGKCRGCGTGISLRYPMVEILTALLFAGLVWVKEPANMEAQLSWGIHLGTYLVYFYVLAVIVAVTFIDLDFQIIPDELTYSGMAIALIASLLLPSLHEECGFYLESLNPHLAGGLSALAGALLGGGTLYLVGVVGRVALKREALGMGDVKYMIFMGGILGAEGVLLVFFIGCALGSVVGLPVRFISGRREIPFGPFLSAGVVLLLFFRNELFGFFLETWPEWIRTVFH